MMIWSGQDEGGQSRTLEGVRVTAVTRRALLEDIEAHLWAKRGFALATLNLDHAVKLRTLPSFRSAYLRHTHITADGNPIVWISRLAGQKVDLVPGSELVEPVAEIAARTEAPVALLGSTPETLEAAGEALKVRHPHLQIAARIAPPMGFDPEGPEAASLIDEIGATGARLCFLALGAPKQEIFAARAMERLPEVGFLSVGAGLDFLSGQQTRAPKLVRRLAAEWLWRLAGNPRRLTRRYLACIAILPSLTVRALHLRTRRKDRST